MKIVLSPFVLRWENARFYNFCYFPVLKQMLKVQLLLDMLEKITFFTRGEQATVNSCDFSTRLRLVLRTSHSLAIARFPHY